MGVGVIRERNERSQMIEPSRLLDEIAGDHEPLHLVRTFVDLRDLGIAQIYEGTNQIQREVIGLSLIKEAAAKK